MNKVEYVSLKQEREQFGYMSSSDVSGSYGRSICSFEELPHLFPNWLHQFVL